MGTMVYIIGETRTSKARTACPIFTYQLHTHNPSTTNSPGKSDVFHIHVRSRQWFKTPQLFTYETSTPASLSLDFVASGWRSSWRLTHSIRLYLTIKISIELYSWFYRITTSYICVFPIIQRRCCIYEHYFVLV